MAKDTRERILEAALAFFAKDGYDGTNLRDIAESVGIVKSALYRHFDSKEALWNALLDRAEQYYTGHISSPGRISEIPGNAEELYEMTLRMVGFTIHDPRIRQVRRILQKEQFRDERIGALASSHFLYDTEAVFTGIFEDMMANGSLRKGDPKMLAFAYTAPVTVLIHLCDREPDRELEAMEKIRGHIRQFAEAYGVRDAEKLSRKTAF